MTENIVRRRDLDFQLFHLFDLEGILSRETYRHLDREVVAGVLDRASQIAEDVLWPNMRAGDENPPALRDGRVVVAPQTHRSVAEIRDSGFLLASRPIEEGGLQLPTMVVQAALGLLKGGDIGATAYLMLTRAGANLLAAHGTEQQKRLFMEPMFAGRFFGTMCLSEPGAGSSLADIATTARLNGDGTYSIKGTKTFISGGDHDLAENIIHLVLARTGDSGRISLFIVPRHLVAEDGTVGACNDVTTVGLNHKMGYRATSNCMLSFGDRDACTGYLVGEAGNGLAQMFHMMNEARIGVGVGAGMLGYAGYLQSLSYARARFQGRLPGAGRQGPVPISEHADVKRMLLQQKAYVEGALSLCLYGSQLVDEKATAQDAETRAGADLLLGLLTPVMKAWPSEFCLEANKVAMQVLGGYGYTTDFPLEKLYRDNRLNLIHEGTNGIQAVDLVSRKIAGDWRPAFDALIARIEADCDGSRDGTEAGGGHMTEALSELRKTTGVLCENMKANRLVSLSNATLYLNAFGHIVVGWLWQRQARAAAAALSAGDGDDFYEGKISAASYFHLYELPVASAWLRTARDMSGLLVNTQTRCL